MGWKNWLVRGTLSALLAGGAGVGARRAEQAVLPQAGTVARGVMVGGLTSDGTQSPDELADHYVHELLARRVRLVDDKETVLLDATLEQLGATVDRAHVHDALAAVGRRGDRWQRIDESLQARDGHISVTAQVYLPSAEVVRQLVAFKEQHDRLPQSARFDFAADTPTDHEDGVLVDSHRAVQEVLAAALRGEERVDVPIRAVRPGATRQDVAAIDRSQVLARYETRYGYVGNQVGRAQNVRRAALGIDGLALMPGERVSFNDMVGPRSIDNGFAQAGEIYKGEMRTGIGGGTCQVASTLHAAAYLGGIDIVERSPHSRPSGYIPVGLDATVAYPHVDFQIRNAFSFPVLVRAVAHEGSLVVELLGAQKPVLVKWDAETVGIKPYKRKVREAHYLQDGKVIRKQAGRRGMTIRKYRHVEFGGGLQVDENTTDHYPPTTEIYLVPRGYDEGELPPLPGDTRPAT